MKDRIILVIADSGLTKSRFADRLKITPAFLSQICSGVRMPSDRTISDICREFRVNETWLRTGEGEMHTSSTQRDHLEQFFSDVLTSAPDARSDCLAAMAKLPPEFWGMLTDCAREIVSNLDTEKRQENPLTLPKVAARGNVDQDALMNANTDVPLPDMESDIIP